MIHRFIITCLLALTVLAAEPGPVRAEGLSGRQAEQIISRADKFERLHSLLVLHEGKPVLEHVRSGTSLSRPSNLKSLSKTVLSLVVGIALDRGVIDSVHQPIVKLLGERVPADATEGVEAITVGHALSLQTGLRSTSRNYYGRWVQSDDWIGHVLTRPMADEPGGRMIYSTGSTHLLAGTLVEATGRSLLELTRDWVGAPLNIRIPDWMRDPQGIHFGGNEMRLSSRALARIGELYRLGGSLDGQRIVSEGWIEQSWIPRGHSPWSNDRYGYGWFITEIGGGRAYYGRGYGGQMLYVVPARALTVVITSDPTPPSAGGRYVRQLHGLVAELIHQL